MPSTPLPHPNRFAPETPSYEAYNNCLASERRAIHALPPRSDPSLLVCARFLGYMIRYASTNDGRRNMSQDVLSCIDDCALWELGQLYTIHLFSCCEHPS